MSMGGSDLEEVKEPAPKEHQLELFVRAGRDGESYGACPFCQRMFMILLYKSGGDNSGKSTPDGPPPSPSPNSASGPLRFTVTTVDLSRPPAGFKKLVGNRVPALVHGEEVITDHEEMVQYIDTHWPEPSLRYNNQTAVEATLGAFSKFSYFVKDSTRSPSALAAELRRIDDYLRDEESDFLCGDELTHLDCLVLPKLQHILIASQAFRGFTPSMDMPYFWAYMARGYRSDSFERSVPSDQEIVAAWAAKPGLPLLTREQRKLYSTDAPPKFTLEVPDTAVLPPKEGVVDMGEEEDEEEGVREAGDGDVADRDGGEEEEGRTALEEEDLDNEVPEKDLKSMTVAEV